MGSTSDLESEELERLRAGVQMMALRALGDPEAAEEVAQETLTRAVRAVRVGRVKWGECLGGFVRGIARHVIVDVFRTRKRSTGLEAVAERANAAQPDDPLTILILAEEQQRVGRALSQLAEGDREILHLSFFAGLTPAEIAERLDEPVSRIRKRKSRALERLRRAFHGDAGAGHDPG